MIYKLKEAMRKNKKNLIIYLMLWLIIAVALIVPLSESITNARLNETSAVTEMMSIYNNFGKAITDVFSPIYFKDFTDLLLKYSLVFIILVVIAIFKNKSKNEYRDIEHGSSDWCEGGEQYRILSNKKGILLAENNYLPTDKRGNVNVLIVGRFRFW